MRTYVHQWPDPHTVAVRRILPDNAPHPGLPWVEMADAEWSEWIAAQPAPTLRPQQPLSPESIEWSTLDFLLRFTAAERAAIRSSTIPEVADFLDLLRAAGTVRNDHPLTEQGMALLVDAGLLAAERRDEILHP